MRNPYAHLLEMEQLVRMADLRLSQGKISLWEWCVLNDRIQLLASHQLFVSQ